LQQQQGQQLAQQQGQAIMQGAFGGDRANLARAQLQGQQNLALGQAIAPLYQQGYTQAANIAAGQQGVVASDLARQMAGGFQLGNLGSAAQTAGLAGAQAQIAAGTLPQQTQQALDTAQYQQFLQERGYPFQTTQFLANIAEGTGALSGNTTTQQQSGGFFSSDERLKKNIEHVGKLNDGQNIYRYQYKDDPHDNTHIGVLGQEALARHKPGVGLDPDGYLAVNYHDVTDDAAHHGKGLVPSSMGGAVLRAGDFARGGYALGGEPDFGSLVAAQSAMYDPITGKKGGQQPGLGIPQQAANAKLQVTPMIAHKQGQDPLTSAANIGKNIAELKGFGDKAKGWFGKTNKPEEVKSPTATTPASGQGTQKVAGLGGGNEPWKPDATNSVSQEYSGTAYPVSPSQDSKPAWYNPSSGGSTGIRVADSGQTMNDASVVDAPVADSTNWQDLSSAADDALSSTGDLSNFGDFFAYGGLVPRQHHAMGKPVMPGMDTGDDPIGDVVASGEQDTKSLQSEQHGVNDQRISGSGGGGGDGGFGAALGIGKMFLSFLKDGGRVDPFAYGGLVPREHHKDGEVAGDQLQPVDLSDILNEPTGIDPNVVALSPDKDTINTSLASRESGGNWRAENSVMGAGGLKGHFGRGQFGQARLQEAIDAGVLPEGTTPKQFMESPDLQRATEDWHFGDISKHIKNKGLDQYIGTTINGVPVTEQGLLNVAHLGGKGGMEKFVTSGGRYDPADANGTHLSDYLALGSSSGSSSYKQEQPREAGLTFGRSGPGKFNGVPSANASIGDVVREYTPSGMPTSEGFWLPAAGFLGGMLASPNRSFLGALGSGLTAGASTMMEYDKLQQQALKNAMDIMKDRFEDTVGKNPATGQYEMMKRDKYDGSTYSADQIRNAQYNIMKSMGVSNPAAYGVSGGAAAQPSSGTPTQAKDQTLLPPPATAKVEGAAAPAAAAKPVSPVDQVAQEQYPRPSANVPKEKMSPSQLQANAFWNWKEAGLPEDPRGILADIESARQRANVWAAAGKSDAPTAVQLQSYIKAQQDRLDKMLDRATSADVSTNTEIRKNQISRADKYADEGSARTAKLTQAISDIDQLASLQAEGLRSGVGSDSINKLKSMYQRITGENMPFTGKDPAGEYEYAVKIAAARVANSIKEIGGQRAPGVTSSLEGKIAPDPEKLTPGAIHLLLGQAKGDALYNLERDNDFIKNHRYEDPALHPTQFSETPTADDKKLTGQDKYNKKIADAYSSLPIPKNDPAIPEIVKHIHGQYGRYGYETKAATPQAPAIPAAADRVVDQVYATPNGNFRWKGTGWERVK
jgi:hypothetical protein